jgi:hypothetical protein
MIETNHDKIHKKLKKKGWDKHYLKKTMQILKKSHLHKSNSVKFLDKSIFWVFIFIMILGNIIIFLGITPILIESPKWLSYLVLFIIGLSFGFFVDYILRHIEMSHHHYMSLGIILPTTSLVSMFIILDFVKNVIKETGLFISINIILALTLYISGYLMPHIIFKHFEHKG